MGDNPQPCQEDQQKLLQEARATRDMFVQEKARVENLLNSTLEKVKIYEALLGATQSQICRAEDLIGDIRFRLCQRGIPSFSIFTPSHLPPVHETPRCEQAVE